MARKRPDERIPAPLPTPDEMNAVRSEVTATLPERRGVTPNGGEVGKPGKGVKGRYTPDGRFVETDSIVEEIRRLLADSWPVGDIKRVLVKQFGGSSKSFGRHISLARKRNLAQLKRSPVEAKSDAMQQWQRLLVEAQREKKRTFANLEACQAELVAMRRSVAESGATGDDLLSLLIRIDGKQDQVLLAEKSFASAQHRVDKYQNTIDAMLGNRAAEKTETKLTGDLKAELAHPTEPLTAADSDRVLMELLAKVKGEIAGGVRESVETPSAN